MTGKPLVSSAFVGGHRRDSRHRRACIAALLLCLLGIFAGRAVIHHVADDASPSTAIVHHQQAAHDDEVDVLMLAALTALLLSVLLGTRPADLVGSLLVCGFRWYKVRRPAPLSFASRPPQRSQLQSFLT